MRLAFAAIGIWIAVTVSGGRLVSAQDARVDGVRALLTRLEHVAGQGDPAAYTALLTDSADRARALAFGTTELASGVTRAVVQERERNSLNGTLPGNGYQLTVDVFEEFGGRARVASWRLDVKRVGDPGTDTEWLIDDESRISSVEDLYKLSLNPTRQFKARDLAIVQDDLELSLASGSVFVSDVDQGTTAILLLGRGVVRFHPAPETERTQVRIFSGADALQTTFDAAFLRLHPLDVDRLLNLAQLGQTPVDPREFKRADRVFREESAKSYGLELGDLSPDAWSILPGKGDLLAEIRTRRFGTLTYTRSATEPEDVRLYQRSLRKTIAQYTSLRKHNEGAAADDEAGGADIDVLHYDIDLAMSPDRRWLDGQARLELKVRANAINNLTLRLADSLTVRSVSSLEYGRLFNMRLKDQGGILISLPATILRGADVTLVITYAGRLEPQPPGAEVLALAQRGGFDPLDIPLSVLPEPAFLYSNGVDWYPRPSASDFATARLRITVPANFDCVASGELDPSSPSLVESLDDAEQNKAYVFNAVQPLRYLAFIVSRFVRAQNVAIGFSPSTRPARERPDGLSYRELNLSVDANPRLVGRGREVAERAIDMVLFYQSLLDDAPYPSLTIAVVENDRPGGHSPAYFAALDEPLPTAPITWRNDPASFDNYPDFFLAHELAHQWWGQAVGWRTYHDQWLSEGFSQYFAALYARRQRGDDVFSSVMRQMRRWAVRESSEGPVSLGYRLGHLQGDSRVYRALVYNKAAVVLHMLREFVGDEPFTRALRRFYSTSRFKNVRAADFKAIMEQETGRPLTRFFDRWIDGSTLPRMTFSYRIEGDTAVLHIEQIGDVFDMPVAVTLRYENRLTSSIIVPVTERIVEQRVPLAGPLRSAEIDQDDGALATIVKK